MARGVCLSIADVGEREAAAGDADARRHLERLGVRGQRSILRADVRGIRRSTMIQPRDRHSHQPKHQSIDQWHDRSLTHVNVDG